MHLFFEILKGTPTWVYALFCYLTYLGIKSTERRVVPFKQVFILPIVFTLWSFHTLVTKFPLTVYTTTLWSFSILAGYYLGWHLNRSCSIQADKIKRLIALPGSLTPLISFLVIFAAKYYFGYTFATDPESAHSILYYGTYIALSGGVTGTFIGKLLSFYHKYKFAKHTELSISKKA